MTSGAGVEMVGLAAAAGYFPPRPALIHSKVMRPINSPIGASAHGAGIPTNHNTTVKATATPTVTTHFNPRVDLGTTGSVRDH
ncbi:hypothetical protein [Streptacidiphilus melanogenes]|uniref:hypothetical protein n=1 Tax=Streptacidiphilus melanogenes TaxID=411235 RepID=UPI00126A10C6|nr:hypothetical protein [Streptacidiphilus melanogenes]